MTDEPTSEPDSDRATFRSVCADVLGHYVSATPDRELAMATLGVLCARVPADAPLTDMLRAFVTAVAPLARSNSPASPEQLAREKRHALENALGTGTVLIVFDATRSNVAVPEGLKAQRDLKFRLAWKMTPPIDLQLSDEGVLATLSFHGERQGVFVPWDAIWGVVAESNGQGVAWPSSAPAGSHIVATKPDPTPNIKVEPVKEQRPKFGVIEGGYADINDTAVSDPPPLRIALKQAPTCAHCGARVIGNVPTCGDGCPGRSGAV